VATTTVKTSFPPTQRTQRTQRKASAYFRRKRRNVRCLFLRLRSLRTLHCVALHGNYALAIISIAQRRIHQLIVF